MTIKQIAKEDYQTISKAQLALHIFVQTQKYKLPPAIDEERFLCAVEILRVLGEKLLAMQPSQENISYIIQTKIRHYFENKKNQCDLTPQAEREFYNYLQYSKVINRLVTSEEIDDISPYVKQVRTVNKLQIVRNSLPDEKSKPITETTSVHEIATGKVYISSERFLSLWKQLSDRQLPPQHQAYKNAFIKGKYIVLLPEKQLISGLINPSFYDSLDATALRSSVDVIEAVYPLMTDAEKEQLLPLTNGPLRDFRETILSLPYKYRASQNNLTDLFRITEKNQLENALHSFCALLTKNKGDLFFLKYDLKQVNVEDFDTLDTVLDRLTDSLRSYFDKNKPTEPDLWNYEQFRLMWLLLVIWFRKTFETIKNNY